ncbi:MAG: hypothetical protein ACOYZ8_13070 [Chloroflexota bacterium]
MARIVVYLQDPEMAALHQLAQQEYRPPKAQAALIIRNELKRLGLVSISPTEREAEEDVVSEVSLGRKG